MNWTALRDYEQSSDGAILKLFDEDDSRAEAFSTRACDMLFDYSKTSIDTNARNLLLELADAAGLATRREAMFSGQIINETEGRAVLHTALRNLTGGPVFVDGEDVIPEVRATLDRMAQFATGCPHGPDSPARRWALHRCGEYRDWRFGSWACNGSACAVALCGRSKLSFCVKCGWRTCRGYAERPRSCTDAGHRRIQDVYHY